MSDKKGDDERSIEQQKRRNWIRGKGKVSGEVNNERALKREGVIRDMKKSLIRN